MNPQWTNGNPILSPEHQYGGTSSHQPAGVSDQNQPPFRFRRQRQQQQRGPGQGPLAGFGGGSPFDFASNVGYGMGDQSASANFFLPVPDHSGPFDAGSGSLNPNPDPDPSTYFAQPYEPAAYTFETSPSPAPNSDAHPNPNAINGTWLTPSNPPANGLNNFVSSPMMMDNAYSAQQYDGNTTTTTLDQALGLGAKRRRDNNDDGGLSGGEEEGQVSEMPRAKSGACARCKGLKVRCEYTTDPDTCKRCLNAGAECIIPGRKKRRPPPKREHLIKQIQDQSVQIQKLIKQLDASQRAAAAAAAHSKSKSTHSPATSTSASYSPPLSPEPQPDVQDWIQRARESFDAFGGLIGLSGAGMTTRGLGLVGEEDLEGEEESDEEDGERYAFAVEDADEEDGDEWLGGYGNPNPDDPAVMSLADSVRTLSAGVGGGEGGVGRRKESGGSAGRSSNAKLATLPPEAAPFGLMADLALKKGRSSSREPSVGPEEQDADIGVANEDYFRPTPAPDPMKSPTEKDQHQIPQILTRGIVSPHEVEKLFKIYYDYMNLSLSLIDPVLYTAQTTYWRSPFLFTVICAIASRHYYQRPDLYPQLMQYAQIAAGTALVSGQKNVEMVQAYILLSLCPLPARRWEDGRGWLYLGLAIRVATDLNLQLPMTAKPQSEQHAREMLNRTRVWLNCFNLDRSTSSQYGKAPIIKNTDYIANHSEDWWRNSPYNLENFDIHICCYNAELRVMSNFRDRIYNDPNHPTGLNKDVDFERIATETDEELKRLGEKWFEVIEKTDMSDPQNRFRSGLLRLAYSYARLVALSFGFQHAFGKNSRIENPFLMRCRQAALDVVQVFVQQIGVPDQRIYIRHGPEAQSVFVTFASSFLVKLLQPKFAGYLKLEQRLDIRRHVQAVVDLLGSPEVSIDDRHGPKLYSRFLKSLLATPMAQVETAGSGPKSRQSQKQREVNRTNGMESDVSHEALSNHSSPADINALSPPPTEGSISFEQFAPMAMQVDPFIMQPSSTLRSQGPEINFSDLFQPPLPFDQEFMQSMYAGPSSWQEPLQSQWGWMDSISVGDVNTNVLQPQNATSSHF